MNFIKPIVSYFDSFFKDYFECLSVKLFIAPVEVVVCEVNGEIGRRLFINSIK
jgi:hypothetical protein